MTELLVERMRSFKILKKISMTAVVAILLLSIIILPPVVSAQDVTIQIDGGWKLKIRITNNGSDAIKGNISLICKFVLLRGFFNYTSYGNVLPGETYIEDLILPIPRICKFNITVNAANESLYKEGLSICSFIFFNK
jgi:hypothetical protein